MHKQAYYAGYMCKVAANHIPPVGQPMSATYPNTPAPMLNQGASIAPRNAGVFNDPKTDPNVREGIIRRANHDAVGKTPPTASTAKCSATPTYQG